VSAFLEKEINRPKRIFTIHNLAYGGHFPREEFDANMLPNDWWHIGGVEFYGGFSMLKAGLVYSDEITTVSPTYAQEICTPEFGYGMEGILLERQNKLSGILNGIDQDVWNPATDPALPFHYSAKRRNPGKQKNKQALLEYFDVEVDDRYMDAPLFGSVGRLVDQKGIDLIIEAIPILMQQTNANFVLVGTGDAFFEKALQQLANDFPGRVFIYIGYSEDLAHLLEAGSDVFIMPSRFEPCGLNQLYSLRYGTPPLVTNTGGLADTVVNASEENVRNKVATGFVMEEVSTASLVRSVQHAITLYDNKMVWKQILATAMAQDFSWELSAQQYLNLYTSSDSTDGNKT
jgi:starch synthase